MSRTLAPAVRRRRPGELDWSADPRLAPDHPFLRTGTWRAFVAGEAESEVRLVASIDPRQLVDGKQVGALGFVVGRGEPGSRDSGSPIRAALAAAESWLAGEGCEVVRCPVQFSTWYGHRVITEGFPEQGGPPLFPMEPSGDRRLSEAIAAAGFTAAHAAASYRVPVDAWIVRARLGERLMGAGGFHDRPIRLDRLDDELRAIHAISTAAFRRSWGFSDITADEFLSIYRPFAPLIDPDLVRLAEAPDGSPVGFVFALVDPAAPAGGPGARFVVKSVAVLPAVRRVSPGIGTALVAAVHRQAAASGYPVAVHACVAEDAYSQRVSARCGQRFRSYATFEKVLR